MTRRAAIGVVVLLCASPLLLTAAQDISNWKLYRSSEYGFEIAYPADWQFVAEYENNYGKPLSGKGSPGYAGETRSLFGLEMEGPDQSQEEAGDGGDFGDGAIITVSITGTTGVVEDWHMAPGRPWYLLHSTPSDWLKRQSATIGGDKVEKVAIDTNGFKGAVEVACNGPNPCKVSVEEGGAYRILPGGRILLVSWLRNLGRNDFSYQKYFLPMLSSFKLLK